MSANNENLIDARPVAVLGIGTTGIDISTHVYQRIKNHPTLVTRTAFMGLDTQRNRVSAAKAIGFGTFRHLPPATKLDGIDPRLAQLGLMGENAQNSGGGGYFSLTQARYIEARSEMRQAMIATRDAITLEQRIREAREMGMNLLTTSPIVILTGSFTGSTFCGTGRLIVEDAKRVFGDGATILVIASVCDTDGLNLDHLAGQTIASAAMLFEVEALMEPRRCPALATESGQPATAPDTVLLFSNTSNEGRRFGSGSADFQPTNRFMAHFIAELCINSTIDAVQAAVANCNRQHQANGHDPFAHCISSGGMRLVAVPLEQIQVATTAKLAAHVLQYMGRRQQTPKNSAEMIRGVEAAIHSTVDQVPSDLTAKLDKPKKALSEAFSVSIKRAIPGTETTIAQKAIKDVVGSKELQDISAVARGEAPRYAKRFIQQLAEQAILVACNDGPGRGVDFIKACTATINALKAVSVTSDKDFSQYLAKAAPNAATTFYRLTDGARTAFTQRASAMMAQRLNEAIRHAFQSGCLEYLREGAAMLIALSERLSEMAAGLDQWQKEADARSARATRIVPEHTKKFVTEDGGKTVEAECRTVLAHHLNDDTCARIVQRAIGLGGEFIPALEEACDEELAVDHSTLGEKFALREEQLLDCANDLGSARVLQIETAGEFRPHQVANGAPDLFIFHPPGMRGVLEPQFPGVHIRFEVSPDPCTVTAISVMGPMKINDLRIFSEASKRLKDFEGRGPSIFAHTGGLPALGVVDDRDLDRAHTAMADYYLLLKGNNAFHQKPRLVPLAGRHDTTTEIDIDARDEVRAFIKEVGGLEPVLRMLRGNLAEIITVKDGAQILNQFLDTIKDRQRKDAIRKRVIEDFLNYLPGSAPDEAA